MSGVRGATLYFDCFAGIAGDMAVAALVDLGVPEEVVVGAVEKMGVGVEVAFERVRRGALVGLKMRVRGGEAAHAHAHAHDHQHGHTHGHGNGDGDGNVHAHRHYAEIRAMIENARLSDGVKARALEMFRRIAVVEAKLHGVSVEEAAFHEVGAIDSIVDIVGVAAALEWIGPARVVARRVALGSGRVKTAHGVLPVPAPATLELLQGIEVEEGGAAVELTTPTGAAIVAATATEIGPLPAMAVAGVGWGAGERELVDRPNLLRVVAGREQPAAGERAVVLEANLDDMSPELAAPLVEELLAAGARDAWLQPVVMKKGRPAFVVAALCDPGARGAVEAALFRESSTIGVRAHAVERSVLARRTVEVATPFGAIPIKVAGPDGAELNAAPEYEACRAAAKAHGVPVKRVYAEALAAFYRR